jgi:transcriptional regulator with XRE-family HTH domain
VAFRTKPIYAPDYRRILAALRKARKDAGLTQAEVAAQLERPQSFVSKCESGERRIDPAELRIFARIYRQPVSYFMEEQPESTTGDGESSRAEVFTAPEGRKP